jgi:hypothetical protein
LATITSNNDETFNRVIDSTLMKNSVSILLAMKEVALEANKSFHTLWPVVSYCHEKRGVAVAITELD